MKLITYSIFRALCAIAVGALLVKYREDMVEWMTIAIGALFFLSGAIAMIASMSKKKVTGNKAAETTDADSTELVYDETNANMNYGEEETATRRNGWGWGSFVGMGSMILGIILILMPKTFVEFLVYIISAFLIIGAVQQFIRGKQPPVRVEHPQPGAVQGVIQIVQGIRVDQLRIVCQHSGSRTRPGQVQPVEFSLDL